MKKSYLSVVAVLIVLGVIWSIRSKNLDKGDDSVTYEKVEVEVDYSDGKKAIGGNGAITFWLPDGWNRMGMRDKWKDSKGSGSCNVSSDPSSATMSLSKYLDLSLKNMKKGIPSYKLISKELKNVNGQKMAVLLGKISMKKQNMTLYSVIIDKRGIKYVLTLGSLTSDFEDYEDSFKNIVNSYKIK